MFGSTLENTDCGGPPRYRSESRRIGSECPSIDEATVPAGTQSFHQMIELDGEADAEHVIQAGTGHAEPRREADPHVPGELPAEHGREIVRRVAERE